MLLSSQWVDTQESPNHLFPSFFQQSTVIHPSTPLKLLIILPDHYQEQTRKLNADAESLPNIFETK
jgi:hypothetical protein